MNSAEFQMRTAVKYGKVDCTHIYNLDDIDVMFRNRNVDIFQSGGTRRKGCYLWKPYFINKALSSLENGDFLVYMDCAGGYYRSSVKDITAYMSCNNINVIGSRRYRYVEKHWTKRDAFVYMDCDRQEYTEQYQCYAGILILRKSIESQKIMDEWLTCAQDYRIITDAPNTCGLENYDGFKEHRYDQSILSLLMKKHNVAIIEELPVADFYIYHHTKETSIKAVKAELARRRRKQIKEFLGKKNFKGIYYVERERLKGTLLVQTIMRRR